jgi:hypothetical protein
MKEDSDKKITSEKPVKIPLNFREALAALLKIKPQKAPTTPKKKPPKPTK